MQTPEVTSPFGLIQERFRSEPWKLLVCCICLNQTSIKQVRPVVERLFEKYHTHEECSKAKHEDIIEIIRPLGFYTRRAKSIIELSKAFVEQKHLDTRKLPGVGKYALDSYKIFIMGELEVNPTDKKLSKYVEWAKEYNKSKRKDR